MRGNAGRQAQRINQSVLEEQAVYMVFTRCFLCYFVDNLLAGGFFLTIAAFFAYF
jgi:hypothetical protein